MQAKPKYECAHLSTFDNNFSEFYPCQPEEFCINKAIEWRIDWTSSESINNFIVYFDLHCSSKFEIGLMGTMIFVGYTISAIIFPRMSDVIGRMLTFRRSFVIHVIGIGLILFVPSYYMIYVGLFLVGLASTVRTAVGYVYSLEFIEIKHQNLSGSIMKTVDVITPIIFSVMFLTVTNDWKVYYTAGFIISLVAWLCSFLIPESPCFLIS